MVGGIFYILGVNVWQPVFGKYAVHFGRILARLAQNIYHGTNGILGPFGPFGDFHDGLVACLTSLELVLGDKNVIGKGAAFGKQKCVVFVYAEFAYEGVLRMFEYFYYFGLFHMVFATSEEGNLYLVAALRVDGV